MKKSLSLKKLFFLFLIFLSITKIQAGDRDLIVLVDTLTEKGRIEKEQGAPPVVENLILAIHQKCAPILLTSSVWLNFKAYKNKKFNIVYSSFLFKEDDWEMYQITQQFFLLVPISYKNKILEEKWVILDNFKDQETANELTDTEIMMGLKIEKLKKIEKPLELSLEFLSGFSQQDLNDVLHKTFVNKKDIKGETETETEDLQAKYLNIWYMYLHGHGSQILQLEKLREALNQINELKEKIGIWPSQDLAYDLAATVNLKTLTPKLFEKIEEFEEIKKADKDPAAIQQQIKELIQESPIPRMQNKTQVQIQNFLKIVNRVGEDVVSKISLLSKQLQQQMTKTLIMISGTPLLSFQLFCNFLNEKISTNLLLYVSCFAGGINLVLPYLKAGSPGVLNYTVICGALTSKPTSSPSLKIVTSDYTGTEQLIDTIKINNQKLKLVSQRDFEKFFNTIKKPPTKEESFAQKINYIHLFLKIHPARIFNIPQIRHPGTQWTQPIDLSKLIQKITRAIIKAREQENKKLVLTEEKIILFLTNNISVPVEIKGNPTLISLLESTATIPPGDITYFLKNLEHTLFFEEIITQSGFLEIMTKTFSGIATNKDILDNKIILIEKLTCKNDLSTEQSKILGTSDENLILYNLILLNKTFDPIINKKDSIYKIYFTIGQRSFVADWDPTKFREKYLLETKNITPEEFDKIKLAQRIPLMQESASARIALLKREIPILQEITPNQEIIKNYHETFQSLTNKITSTKEEEGKQKTIPEVLEKKKAEIEVRKTVEPIK